MPLPIIPPRSPESHKGDFGRALLIGGSRGMAGAVALAGKATLRSGAGLVRLATPLGCQATVAGFEPAYMTIGLPEDAAGHLSAQAAEQLTTWLAQATVVACGPGLGRSAALDQLAARLYREVAVPAVFDADAINALAAQPQVLSQARAPRVLTPHPGEFARLLGRSRIEPAEREPLAREFAARNNVVLLLKGHHTIITDGRELAVNQTGNPGMATGGSGDVLTGIITGLLCQNLSPLDAARLGAHLHGLAGDLAAAQLGQISLIASDIIDFLPQAFQQHQAR